MSTVIQSALIRVVASRGAIYLFTCHSADGITQLDSVESASWLAFRDRCLVLFASHFRLERQLPIDALWYLLSLRSSWGYSRLAAMPGKLVTYRIMRAYDTFENAPGDEIEGGDVEP